MNFKSHLVKEEIERIADSEDKELSFDTDSLSIKKRSLRWRFPMRSKTTSIQQNGSLRGVAQDQ
jgi:hypothetical protein